MAKRISRHTTGRPATEIPAGFEAAVDRSSGCQWPFGEPRTKEFRLCGAARVPGKPYCQAHMDTAYINRGISPETVKRSVPGNAMNAPGFTFGGHKPPRT